jgi:hypothetical protein
MGPSACFNILAFLSAIEVIKDIVDDMLNNL